MDHVGRFLFDLEVDIVVIDPRVLSRVLAPTITDPSDTFARCDSLWRG